MGETASSPASLAGQRVRRAALRVAAAGALAVSFAGGAGAVVCVSAPERDSLSVRTLQTRLMVAALVCEARADYNAFVERFRPQLVGHSGTLKSYFRKAYGAGASRALDAYVTRLANEASVLSSADRAAFCRTSRQTFDALLTASASALGQRLVRVATDPAPAGDAHPVCNALSRR